MTLLSKMPYPKIMLCKSKRVKQQLPFFCWITIWGCTLDSASAQRTDQQLSPVLFSPLGKSATERNPSVEQMLVADTDAGSMNVDGSQPGSTKLSKGSQVVNKLFFLVTTKPATAIYSALIAMQQKCSGCKQRNRSR